MRTQQYKILDTIKHNKRLMYKVQCVCGKIELKRKDYIDSNRTTSCKSCSAKETSKKYKPPVNSKTMGSFSGTHYNAIKHGALRRNLEFKVSQEYLWNLFNQQSRKCALTGESIILTANIKNNNVVWSEITASVDRIDNSKGYVPGNVWWVHKEVNRLKNNYSLDQLLYWCSRIVKTHGNPERSSVNEIKVTENVQRLEGEDSTNNPSTNAQPRYTGEDIV